MVLATLLVMAAAASFAYASVIDSKLPKCSGKLCRDVACSPDVLCATGTSVIDSAGHRNWYFFIL